VSFTYQPALSELSMQGSAQAALQEQAARAKPMRR
jgi:hypothetical protein